MEENKLDKLIVELFNLRESLCAKAGGYDMLKGYDKEIVDKINKIFKLRSEAQA